MHLYFVYMLTNPGKTVLYIGVTNDLSRRITEHRKNAGKPRSFTGRYNCYHLVYYEEYDCIETAIEREKVLKNWSRAKKERLINSRNPGWAELDINFLD